MHGDRVLFALDRRHALLASAAVMAMILGAYIVARGAERRLNDTRGQVQAVERRQVLMGELLEMALNAETGQRGYVITGDDSFLEPYRIAVARRGPLVERLRRAYLGNARYESVRPELEALLDRRFVQLAQVIELRKTDTQGAIDYISNKSGKMTMDAIRLDIADIRTADVDLADSLLRSEERDVRILHLTSGGGAALNILLVLVAGLMVSRDLRRRALLAQQLERDKQSLESKVDERTEELRELSSHLQDVTERERSALARELHDELGGLLVAAKMDVSWLQQHGSSDAVAPSRWRRLVAVLDAGVDLKRRLVEQLRPSLLDNMGLMVALQWQFQESCGHAGLECVQELPEAELDLTSEAAIAIFRMAQEATTNVLKHAQARVAYMGVRVTDEFILTIRDDGRGLPPGSLRHSHGLTGMRHRAEGLGGTWRASSRADGKGTEIEVRLPLGRILKVPEGSSSDSPA